MNDTLQFPLPLLAFGKNQRERLDTAIIYATFTTGQHRLKVLSPPQIAEELNGMKLPRHSGEITDEQIRVFALGGKFCGINSPDTPGTAKVFLRSYQAAENFMQSWKSAGRTAPWTRVPKKMVFEARNGTAKTYLRFTALCAVNAAIGRKPFAIVTRNRVRAGMLGYSSGKILFDKFGNLTNAGIELLKGREEVQEPVSGSQVRTLLDNFAKTGLLNRFTPYRGSLTYYSKNNPDNPKNMTAEKIGEALLVRARRTGQNPKLKQLGELIRQAKQGQPLLSGEGLEKSPHNTDSPHNRETAAPSPPVHIPIATPSPHNAAFNAALNASKNASENAGSSLADSVQVIVGSIARGMTASSYPEGGEPSLEDVRKFMDEFIPGAGEYAEEWVNRMKQQAWKDHKGQPVRDWKKLAASWASGCVRRKRGVRR
jgi:hypothetical protein